MKDVHTIYEQNLLSMMCFISLQGNFKVSHKMLAVYYSVYIV